MNILHMLSQLPKETGSGIYLQAMIRESRRAGHRNALLAATQTRIPDIPVNDQEIVHFQGDDLPWPIVGMSDVMPYISRTFASLSPADISTYLHVFIEKSSQLIRRFSPQIIHSHHLWLMTAQIRRRHPGIPMVATCHGSDLRQFHNCPHLRHLVRDPCRTLDAVLALSRAQRKEIADIYDIPSRKIHVTGAGYDDNLFKPAEKPPANPVIITYAGKLSRAKGVIYLLKALHRLPGRSWQLHLAGDGAGPEKDEILTFISATGAPIHRHGMISQAAFAQLLQKTHIFVLPSFFEGLPLVLLEALASGCRLIATDLPGVREIFRNDTFDIIQRIDLPAMTTIDKPDPASIPRFIDTLAGALEQQIAATIRQPEFPLSRIASLLTEFTWPAVFQRVSAVYKMIA